jgi:hypothetical protein
MSMTYTDEILYATQDLADFSPRFTIAVLPKTFALYPIFNISDNILLHQAFLIRFE